MNVSMFMHMDVCAYAYTIVNLGEMVLGAHSIISGPIFTARSVCRVFGGFTPHQVLGDTLLYNFSSGIWTALSLSVTPVRNILILLMWMALYILPYTAGAHFHLAEHIMTWIPFNLNSDLLVIFFLSFFSFLSFFLSLSSLHDIGTAHASLAILSMFLVAC